jgi:hypothetical protein
MELPDGIYWISMGEKDGVIDVAPNWVLHRKTAYRIFLGRFLFLPYFSLALGLSTLD